MIYILWTLFVKLCVIRKLGRLIYGFDDLMAEHLLHCHRSAHETSGSHLLVQFHDIVGLPNSPRAWHSLLRRSIRLIELLRLKISGALPSVHSCRKYLGNVYWKPLGKFLNLLSTSSGSRKTSSVRMPDLPCAQLSIILLITIRQ